MNGRFKLLIIGMVLCSVLLSCEKEPESYNELLISFSNGITLDQDDIVFYDSAECIFLIKDTLNFQYYSVTDIGPDHVDFSVSLDGDTIYKGIIFLSESSLTPSTPIYIAQHIDGKYFDSNILDLKYYNPYDPTYIDERNNTRIISFLEGKSKLRNGIKVTLDSVRLSSENDSCLITTISYYNHDDINYYLPDPNKMGSIRFSFFTGGLTLLQNRTYSKPIVDYSLYNLYDHRIENLSILEAKSQVTYTFKTWYNEPLEIGHCEGKFRFVVLRRFTHMELPLEQEDGWVWVGDKFFRFKNLLVE